MANRREHGHSGHFEVENLPFSRATVPLHYYSLKKKLISLLHSNNFEKIYIKLVFCCLSKGKPSTLPLKGCQFTNFTFRLLKGPMSVYFSYLDHSARGLHPDSRHVLIRDIKGRADKGGKRTEELTSPKTRW